MRRSLGGFTLVAPLFVVAGTLLSGCSSSGGGGGGTGGGVSADGSARVAFLLQDGAARDLYAFGVTFARLRLVDDHGKETDNLLVKQVSLDLLGLRDGARLLATASVPPGTYQSVTMVFAPGGVDLEQLDLSGPDLETKPVPFNLATRAFSMPLATDLQVKEAQVRYVLVDFDLDASLDGEVGVRPLEVAPSARASVLDETSRIPAAPFKGVVRSVGSDRFEIEAFADADLKSSAGFLSVRPLDGALLLDANLSKVASRSAFLADLQSNVSVVEVRGDLAGDGSLRASMALIEDEGVQDWSATQVEIAGSVVGKEPGRFQLLIEEFVRSGEHANNVLAGLGRPLDIPVTYDTSARFVVDGERISDRTALKIGQRVKVAFTFFASFPFPAGLVEIRHGEPMVRGTLVDVSGLPDSVVIHADAAQAALIGGKIESDATDVTVDLTGATIELALSGAPLLDPAALELGMAVDVRGSIEGKAPAPSIVASDLRVATGLLIGNARAIDRKAAAVDLRALGRSGAFGSPEPGFSPKLVLLPKTRYTGAATNETELFDLFDGLGLTQDLRLSVRGISSGATDEVLAYAVDVSVAGRLVGAHSIQLWPPDQKYVIIDLRNFIPKRPGDEVEDIAGMTVFSIEQDEEVDPTGNGTRPDGWIVGDGVILVRAERDPKLNGRVYEVKFAYPDGSSPSTLFITVPIKEFLNPAVDDGVRYDSTDAGM